jgi:Family of unknown function (DUF6318)
MGRRWTALAGACLATVLLAGCSGGTQQASTTLPTATAPTAAASPTLPPLGPPDFPVPAEARERTPAAITAFARYYVALINHQLSTLDGAPLRELSQDCSTCSALADSYDRGRAAGHRYLGGALNISSISDGVLNGQDGDISFLLDEEQVTVLDATGTPIADLSRPPVKLSGGMTFHWDANRASWLVTQLTADKA